jgi:hypothetical protein
MSLFSELGAWRFKVERLKRIENGTASQYDLEWYELEQREWERTNQAIYEDMGKTAAIAFGVFFSFFIVILAIAIFVK